MLKNLWFLVAVLVFLSCNRSKQETNSMPAAHPVLTATVETHDLSDIRKVSAPVVAYKRVYITARTAGQVLEVHFEEGNQIRQGQVMARLDTRKQEAQLRNARAMLVEARKNFDRQKHLYEQEVITPTELETATLSLEQAESEVEFWEAETDLGTIRSPIDAIVSDKLVETGTSVNANDRLFTIEDHSLLVVRPSLTEMDVATLSEGMTLPLYFDVFGDTPGEGSIRRIFPAADAITRLFTVEVEINQDKLDKPLRPGYLARAQFILDDHQKALSVPSEAIVKKEDRNLVYVIENNKVSAQEVTTGVEREGRVEIVSGLEEGMQVAAGNIASLEDNTPVNVVGNFRRYGFRD